MPGNLKEVTWSNLDRSFLLETVTEFQANIPHTKRDDFSPQSCPALLDLTWIHSGSDWVLSLKVLGSKSVQPQPLSTSVRATLLLLDRQSNVMARKKKRQKNHTCCGNIVSLRCKKNNHKKMLYPYWKTYSGYHGNNNEICRLSELHSAVQQMSTTGLIIYSSLNSDFLWGTDFNLLKNKISHTKMNISYEISSLQCLHILHILIFITSLFIISDFRGKSAEMSKDLVELRSPGFFLSDMEW